MGVTGGDAGGGVGEIDGAGGEGAGGVGAGGRGQAWALVSSLGFVD